MPRAVQTVVTRVLTGQVVSLTHHGTFLAMDTGHACCTTLCAAASSTFPYFSLSALLLFPPTLPALCCSPLAGPLCPARVPAALLIYMGVFTGGGGGGALRYVRRVQLGAYMWQEGLNSIKTGSKWAKNTCLCIPNGPRPLLEKHIVDPSLTHFCSQNGPFSRHIGIFHGPKPVPMGSKWAKNTCLGIPNGQQ